MREALELIAKARGVAPQVSTFVRDAASVARQAQEALEALAKVADSVSGKRPGEMIFERDPRTGVYREVKKWR